MVLPDQSIDPLDIAPPTAAPALDTNQQPRSECLVFEENVHLAVSVAATLLQHRGFLNRSALPAQLVVDPEYEFLIIVGSLWHTAILAKEKGRPKSAL